MDRERPEGAFVKSTAVSVSAALALSAFYTFFKPVLNLQNSRPIEILIGQFNYQSAQLKKPSPS